MSQKPVSLSSEAFEAFFMNVSDLTPGAYVEFGSGDFDRITSDLETDGLPAETVGDIADAANGLIDLLDCVEPALIEDRDESALLSVKVDAEGDPERIYAPAIFRDGDDLIFKIGKNTAAIDQDGDRFSCGELSGKLRFKSAQTEDGDDYTLIFMRLTTGGDEPLTFVTQCLTEPGTDYTEDDIEAAIENNEPLSDFLRQIGSGGFIKLRDLEIGDYRITGIVEPEGLKYGRFELVTEAGQVSPNKKLHNQIEALAATLPLEKLSAYYAGRTLRIKAKTQKGDRCFVTAQIVKVAPTDAGDATIAPARERKQLTPATEPTVTAIDADADTIVEPVVEPVTKTKPAKRAANLRKKTTRKTATKATKKDEYADIPL